MSKSIFYHAGCSVCVSAEQDVLSFIPSHQIDIVHLGTDKVKLKRRKEQELNLSPHWCCPMAAYCILILELLLKI